MNDSRRQIGSVLKTGSDPNIGSDPIRDFRIAIVHDDFIQRGGAERLVLAILEIFPQADLYGVIATKQWQRVIKKQSNKEIKTSWLQKFPFKERFFRYYYALYPLAVESFRFKGYDLVISSSARYAHGVLTRPETVHIAYVNSPARFLWEENLAPGNILARPIVKWHRAWDKIASQRPDYIIANSQTPAERIRKYWKRRVDAVIYPFVDLERFAWPDLIGLDPLRGSNPQSDYFLVVSRLKRWKRIDVAIEACNQLKLPLFIVGQGEDEGRLRRLAGPAIRFFPEISDEQLISFYQNCRALIMTQVEDFGITALEAQAAGRPAVALSRGGSLETIVDGVTGVYFGEASVGSLVEVLRRFDGRKYLRQNCLRQAQKFDKDSFQRSLKDFVSHALQSR